MGGVVLIIVLTIAGGIIAYAGDRIGMKVGRKRLSIFGLRPKYTSMVITIITGVVIAAYSPRAITCLENVRIALFEIRELRSHGQYWDLGQNGRSGRAVGTRERSG